MGLAVVTEIVHSYGGKIRVDESPLGGARFHITLPDRSGPGQCLAPAAFGIAIPALTFSHPFPCAAGRCLAPSAMVLTSCTPSETDGPLPHPLLEQKRRA